MIAVNGRTLFWKESQNEFFEKKRHIEDIGRTALFFFIYIMMSAVILTSRYCEADHKFYNLFSADIYIKMASVT